MDIASSLTIAQSAVDKQGALMNIAKKQHQIETNLLDMLMNVAQSAPPPGQGNTIDKSV